MPPSPNIGHLDGNMKRFIVVCLVGLLVFGCAQAQAPTAVQPRPTALAGMPPTTPSAQALTARLVQNMQVRLNAADNHPLVQLTNGEYHSGGDPASSNYADIRIVADHITFGDLNGDGLGDAAILLAENYGGTGVFVSVFAILDSAGEPVLGGARLIDDRPEISDLVIQNGRIIFTGKIHGPNDPGCCAAEAVTETFALDNAGLHLRRFASSVSSGPQRAIVIESPRDAEQIAAGTMHVKGTFTVPPFENTLTYHVTDVSGREWNTGAFQVAANSNGPGEFSTPIDLGMVPPGIPVLLEIQDVSAADGSTIAMDSVQLTTK
jgi:hypothetical protein